MSRNRKELHPQLQEKMEKLKAKCQASGLIIGISECVRTPAEQDALYAIGRTAPGKIVTNCRGSSLSSMHQWGVAFDFYRNDGKGAYVDVDGFFTKVGKIGQAIGLEWGGGWRSPVDKPHFQLPDWGSTAAGLKALYGSPERFRMSWNGDRNQAGAPSDMQINKQTVRAVQKWLVEFTGWKLVLDGVYGKNSKKAMIMAVQRTAHMKANGKITDELYRRIATVRLGRVGDIVRCLEGLLFVHGYDPADFQGICTDAVARAIGRYQRDHKLAADRMAGKNTFKKLLE